MRSLMEPLSRLKWGFIPSKREVDEGEETNFDEASNSLSVAEAREGKAGEGKAGEETVEKEEVHVHSRLESLDQDKKTLTLRETEFEYRDEKGRRWWKFFDEYEYRLKKDTRSKHKWFKWFNENDTAEERKLLIKLDILLTFYSFIAYWAKYLDQVNLTNAYIGGLKEGIGMKGNDFVNTQVMFTVGNIVFQIPFMYILYGLPLNFVLPSLDICWSILTICVYKVHHVKQLKALRFFIGAFEAPSYLAYQFLFGSWYKVDEISRRSMVYYFGQYLGILTSGLLSGAIVDNFEGVNGLSAWRWIFIIDGIITLAVGIIGFYMIPGTPYNCYSIFLSDNDIRVARKRLKENNSVVKNPKDTVSSLFNWKLWKSILTSWEVYVVSIWGIFCWNNNNGSSGAYALWLKSLNRYSPGQLQNYTSLTPGLGLVWLLLTCCYADLFHSRWQAIFWSQMFNFIGNVLLAVWNIPESAKWFAWCLQYFGWAMAPVLYSWNNDICRRDNQKRAVILVVLNMLSQSSTAWLSVIVWKTVEAPRYLKGYTFTACCAFMLCLWTLVVLFFYKKTERKHARANGIILFNSDSIESVETTISKDKF